MSSPETMNVVEDGNEVERTVTSINFWINGKPFTVGAEYDLTTSLNEFIREVTRLKGTKVMCHEGGCGCCTVTVTIPDLAFHRDKTFAINSCLCPLYSCDGWQVTTVEGLGSQKTGFHPIQDRVARFNATQCGYCTPGMVMSMYGLLQEHPKPTQQEIEDNFDGNICRCTGYRPILDAMKSFASDSRCIDIEDLNLNLCPTTGQPCNECRRCDEAAQKAIESAERGRRSSVSSNGSPRHSHGSPDRFYGSPGRLGGSPGRHRRGEPPAKEPPVQAPPPVKEICPGLHIEREGTHWYQPHNLETLQKIVQANADRRLKLLAGNTAVGIYKNEGPFEVYVNLCRVKDLFTVEMTEHSVLFGSGLSLTNLITMLWTISEKKNKNDEYSYFAIIAEYLKKVANVQVRNIGTWAGNLMIRKMYPDFPSDIFTPFEAVGARVHIFDTRDGSATSYPLLVFMNDVVMRGKVITALELLKMSSKEKLRLFKIMPRSQNAHAYLNAAFCINIDVWKLQVVGRPSIVFGGISATMVHAEKTEAYMKGKKLTDVIMMKHMLDLLKSEIHPSRSDMQASPKYRQDVAVNLFYKFMLELCEKQVKTQKYHSGKFDLLRPLSSGRQLYDIVAEHEQPLKAGMPKVNSVLQAAGEVKFLNDLPPFTYELAGSLVLAAMGPATIKQIDPSVALSLPGVVDFVTANHIPKKGVNNYLTQGYYIPEPDEIFCSGKVQVAGQVVGMILAGTQAQADAAAQEVEIEYTEVYRPILTIADALQAKSVHNMNIKPFIIGDPAAAFRTRGMRTVTGECSMEPLYHFYLENNVALCVPKEDSMDVFITTQWPDQVQIAVSQAIGKPMNYVDVTIPQIGGSFGGKLCAAAKLAAATAVAAHYTERPVRSNVNLNTNMQFNGMRFPLFATYKAGFDESGKIKVVEVELYLNAGYTTNCAQIIHEITGHLDSGYFIPNWQVTGKVVKTDRQGGQPMRSPGPYPAGFIIESIIDHVAKLLVRDPTEIKEINLCGEGQMDINGIVLQNCTLRRIWSELKQSAEVEKRVAAIASFNKVHQWKKRGLTMTPEKYGIFCCPSGFQCQMSIYAHDGTVSLSQGGIEVGQGLFTKVVQAVSHSLQIPMEMVKVKPVSTQVSPNQDSTGGSSTSEMCVESALMCCEILKGRMAPVTSRNPDAPWTSIVSMCKELNIDLSAQVKVKPDVSPDRLFKYHTYAVACAEVEFDVLTGEHQILRVDILFDSGESLNPEIDIGQIEGAYIMGLGGYLLEKVIYDPETGRVINNGTWDYQPPTTKDIPIDFRIKLLSNSQNPLGTRSSKASGEPPIVLSSGVLFALKQAVEAAKQDCSDKKQIQFVTPVAPFTVEKAQQECDVRLEQLLF